MFSLLYSRSKGTLGNINTECVILHLKDGDSYTPVHEHIWLRFGVDQGVAYQGTNSSIYFINVWIGG